MITSHVNKDCGCRLRFYENDNAVLDKCDVHRLHEARFDLLRVVNVILRTMRRESRELAERLVDGCHC